jgi:hypothetical protein
VITRTDLLSRLQAVLCVLSEGVTDEDVAHGWDVHHVDAVRQMLTQVRDSLTTGSPLPEWSIVLTIDSWGISSGRLLDEIVGISNMLDDIRYGPPAG